MDCLMDCLQDPKVFYHHVPQIELEGSTALAATNYSKRPNVFRLKLTNGGDFLFQCKDEASGNIFKYK